MKTFRDYDRLEQVGGTGVKFGEMRGKVFSGASVKSRHGLGRSSRLWCLVNTTQIQSFSCTIQTNSTLVQIKCSLLHLYMLQKNEKKVKLRLKEEVRW